MIRSKFIGGSTLETIDIVGRNDFGMLSNVSMASSKGLKFPNQETDQIQRIRSVGPGHRVSVTIGSQLPGAIPGDRQLLLIAGYQLPQLEIVASQI